MHYKICKKNNNRLVTNQILENAGFENITQIFEKRYYKEGYDIDDYTSYVFCTNKIDKKNPIKIYIDNSLTNSGRKWNVHVDNKDCCSIGKAEVDTVYQFNILMKLFDSKLRL